MFAVERINILKSYLRERGKLDVHSMSELLSVSEVTVRRDLEKLETEGFLTRMHGGAIIKGKEKPAPSPGQGPEYAKEELDREEIARVAFLMVKDNDVIMLMNGPIALCLARMLEKRVNVTVLTNDIQVVIARWFMSLCRIFIMDEPTRGVYAAARIDIYNAMNDLVTKGASIILISSDIEEIIDYASG